MRGGSGPVIAVIGGAGAMGRIVARDLSETAPPGVEILLADLDLHALRRVAASLPRRVRVESVDASRPRQLARAIGGAAVLVNACHHDFNLRIMDAALAIGSHYCDLGGLFHVTRLQLRRHHEFRRAGLLAVCGIGSSPGIVNVMARAGAARLERVDAIHVAVGTVDRAPRPDGFPLATSYSLRTVLDEASRPAALFTRGRLRFVPPLGLTERVAFPLPVGRQAASVTLHSELATLPGSFRHAGVREVSFRIALPGGLAERLRLVHALGLTGAEPLRVGAARVAPRDLLLALAASAPKAAGPRDEYEVLRVVLEGRRDGRRVVDTLDCHVPGVPAWGIGVDIDTGAPPSIVAQMILKGIVTARGVLPPERVVPPGPFFRELGRRHMTIRRRSRPMGRARR